MAGMTPANRGPFVAQVGTMVGARFAGSMQTRNGILYEKIFYYKHVEIRDVSR